MKTIWVLAGLAVGCGGAPFTTESASTSAGQLAETPDSGVAVSSLQHEDDARSPVLAEAAVPANLPEASAPDVSEAAAVVPTQCAVFSCETRCAWGHPRCCTGQPTYPGGTEFFIGTCGCDLSGGKNTACVAGDELEAGSD